MRSHRIIPLLLVAIGLASFNPARADLVIDTYDDPLGAFSIVTPPSPTTLQYSNPATIFPTMPFPAYHNRTMTVNMAGGLGILVDPFGPGQLRFAPSLGSTGALNLTYDGFPAPGLSPLLNLATYDKFRAKFKSTTNMNVILTLNGLVAGSQFVPTGGATDVVFNVLGNSQLPNLSSIQLSMVTLVADGSFTLDSFDALSTPEPGQWAMAAVATGGFFLARRRNRTAIRTTTAGHRAIP